MPATALNRRRAGALALALLFAVSAVRADVHADLADVLATMTGALADDNPAAFLAAIDKKSPDYARLSTYVTQLLQQGAVSSSVEFLKDEGSDTRRTVQLDWYLEIHTSGPLAQRRKVIDCVFEKQGRHWRIVSLSPSSFFAPHNYE